MVVNHMYLEDLLVEVFPKPPERFALELDRDELCAPARLKLSLPEERKERGLQLRALSLDLMETFDFLD